MGRLAWSQVWFRPARALALTLGLLIAATAFTVLTAASGTWPPATTGTTGAVPANYHPGYGILVRNGHVIGVIRVSLAGPVPGERVKAVAQQIARRAGLDVVTLGGPAPPPADIDLATGENGQPALPLAENAAKANGVKSEGLFALILVVCVLFVANAATAAVRARRRELGVLSAVGWRRSRLFAIVLGELSWIGLAAGLLAAGIAVLVSAALGRDSPGRALLAVPVAMAVAVAGALVPAWLAARADPVSSVRPPAPAIRRVHHPRGITSLALLNVARTPGRTLIAVVSLAVGIATLTAGPVAFHDRGADYIAAGTTVVLGVLAVTDVLFLNIAERATELATIRGFGWRDAKLTRLVITEGAIIAVAGSVTGSGAGLGVAAWLTGQLPARLIAIAVAAAGAGILITAAAALLPAALLPAALLRSLPARLLAEE
jgi:putative ABC transport system permease protein